LWLVSKVKGSESELPSNKSRNFDMKKKADNPIDEPDIYILNRQGEIEKETLTAIFIVALITLPDQFRRIDPYHLADEIEPNLDQIDKEKIPLSVAITDINLLDYKEWGHFRLAKFPEGFFE
jgi:hypothetical protein